MPATITARSPDGTTTRAVRSGQGPSLLLVHGIAGDASRWSLVSPMLEERYTVYAMDRRGRGASGDAVEYALLREAEDVAALVEAIGGEVLLFGHSFGALVALEAASRAAGVTELLVYEPYFPEVPVPTASPTTLRYGVMLETGDRGDVVEAFCREIVQMSEADVARMREHPTWASRVACAHTLVREMGAVEQHAFDPSPLRARALPFRMLLGSESPPFLKDATSRLHGLVPGSDVVILEGQSHIAMDSAPDLFVRAVTAFFG